MSAVHEHTLRTSCAPAHVQLGCDGTYLALPHGRNNVAVWSLQDITCKPLELIGHGRPVSALCFSKKPPPLLVSCATDYIILWHIERCRAAVTNGQQVRGQIIGRTLGSVRYCSLSNDDTMVAVCVDKEVFVLDAKQEQLRHTLEGHTASVNCAEFCPHYTATLVTASDDRTFKVWDLSSATLVYQSTIISSSPFISITMNPLHESFALGTADGQIRVYDLTDGNGFRCLHHIDLEKLLHKLTEANNMLKKDSNNPSEKTGPIKISSRPQWQRPEATQVTPAEEVAESDVDSEAGSSIISMVYTYNHGGVKTPTPCHLPFLQDDSLVSELLENAPMMAVVTTAAILQLNARTFELCSYTSLQEPIPSYSVLEEKPMTVSLVGSSALAQSLKTPDLTWCALGNLFGNEVSVLRLGHPTHANQNQLRLQLATLRNPNTGLLDTKTAPTPAYTARSGLDAEDDAESSAAEEALPVTVLSSGPLTENSPLKAEMVLKADTRFTKKQAKGRLGSTRSVPGRRSSASSDGPLVFHEKIKSSGYSTPPRARMFSPNLNARKPMLNQSLSKSRSTPDVSATKVKEYPTTGDPPTKVTVKLDSADRPTAINSVRFSGDHTGPVLHHGDILYGAGRLLGSGQVIQLQRPLVIIVLQASLCVCSTRQVVACYTAGLLATPIRVSYLHFAWLMEHPLHQFRDGQQLLCALANTTAQMFRMPLTGRGAAFTGHNGVVTSAQWSHDNKWVITSSDDRTASIWSTSLPDPVMNMATSKDNFGADKEGGLKPSKDNPAFGKSVKYSQFYYMDKFVLLTCGASFNLYKFHLDTTKSDIKRYLSNNRYKLVSSWQLEHSQQITAFSAVNSFYSYLALCGGSNKVIEVFDLNVGKNVRTIHDVHTRAPHVICQNEGSSFVSHPASSYDLFVTAAASDCIKLWDLRSNRCVRRYEGHVNRVHPCGVSISPCSRFIATGSEDRSAYIFDIRSGTYLHKLMGHTDTVGQVAFHPLYPQLLTASMDGKLRLFTT